MTTVLMEPFENVSAWTAAGTPTIVSARTNNGVALSTAGDQLDYDIPSGDQTNTLILGFAVNFPVLPASGTAIVEFRSDAGATIHDSLNWGTGPVLLIRRAGSLTVLTTSTISITTGTWNYIEVRLVLGDSPNGVATVRLNNTQIGTATSIDTKNAGTKTVFDRIRIRPPTTSETLFDDLYLLSGSGESFLGDQIITTTPQANVWNGSAFVNGGIKVWNGTTFVDAVAVKTWNGSAFV
jgi:hypothetical protein